MKKIKILLSGGGSGGPVTPLLALVEKLKEDNAWELDCLWLGTENGPERGMVERENITFQTISHGKLRRYFSWQNFVDPFLIIMGFFQAISIMIRFRPDIVLSAGAFVSVPIAWAAFLLRIPIVIHQQDLRPGLANRLMAPFATRISVTFEKSLLDYGPKAIWTGNPMRQDFCTIKLTKREAGQKFGLRSDKPVLVVMGGGTGAIAINQLVEESIEEFSKFCQLIHITGKDKSSQKNVELSEKYPNYKFFEFLDIFGIIKAYAVAELMVSRCGMSSLTELSQLGIASVLIPMPDSHQEENAEVFREAEAALVLEQKSLDKEIFIREIKSLLGDKQRLTAYREKIKTIIRPHGSEAMAKVVKEIIDAKS